MDAAEVRDLISSLEQDVGRCLEDGVKQYKVLMDSLLESEQPLTDSQLLHFHHRNVEIIKAAFDKSYEEIIKIPQANISRKIKQLVNNAKQQLDTHAGQQFRDIYVRKHEIQIDAIVKKVKGITNQAEMLYDEAADSIQPQDSNDRDVKKAHKKCAKKARQHFKKLQKSNRLDQEFFRCELNHRLKERLEDFLSEVPESGELAEDTTSTLTPEPLSDAEITQILEPVKQDLLHCINEGLASYTAFMESLLEANQPLTDSQIFQYHSNIVQTIINAVDTSYTDTNGIEIIEITSKIGHLVNHDKLYEQKITNSVPNSFQQIQQLLSNAKLELKVQISKQFNNFVRNHFVLMERSKNLVDDLSLQAIKYYDEHLQQRLSLEISLGELIMTHWTWEQKALTLLDQLLIENNFEETIFWKHDLAEMLQERLKELIFKMDAISTKPVPRAEDLLHRMKEGLASYTAHMESLLETNQLTFNGVPDIRKGGPGKKNSLKILFN